MKPKAIVDHLERVIGVDGVPITLKIVIERELTSAFGLSAIEAAEKAEQLSRPVAKIIEERSTISDQSGTSPILSVVGSVSEVVCGFCHVLASDPDSVATVKRRRRNIKVLLEKIRSLTFSQFETFGKKVLEELGAGGAKVTPHSSDQGIDFYGYFSIGQLNNLPPPFFKLAHEVRLLIAGQAKHYPDRALGPEVVRELVGAASLARTKTFSNDGIDIFKDLNIRPFSPVVTLLFTTGRITRGAMHLAEAAGVIAKSGEQLAVFLADQGVGMVKRGDQLEFNESNFERWLTK
jgi:hypothetical protein